VTFPLWKAEKYTKFNSKWHTVHLQRKMRKKCDPHRVVNGTNVSLQAHGRQFVSNPAGVTNKIHPLHNTLFDWEAVNLIKLWYHCIERETKISEQYCNELSTFYISRLHIDSNDAKLTKIILSLREIRIHYRYKTLYTVEERYYKLVAIAVFHLVGSRTSFATRRTNFLVVLTRRRE